MSLGGARERRQAAPAAGRATVWRSATILAALGAGWKPTVHCRARQASVLAAQPEVHLHRGNNRDGVSIKQRRLIPPLRDGVQRGLNEQRMAAQHAQIVNCPSFVDDGLQLDDTLYVHLDSEPRVDRFGLMDEFGRRDAAANPHGFLRHIYRNGLGRWWLGGRVINAKIEKSIAICACAAINK